MEWFSQNEEGQETYQCLEEDGEEISDDPWEQGEETQGMGEEKEGDPLMEENPADMGEGKVEEEGNQEQGEQTDGPELEE